MVVVQITSKIFPLYFAERKSEWPDRGLTELMFTVSTTTFQCVVLTFFWIVNHFISVRNTDTCEGYRLVQAYAKILHNNYHHYTNVYNERYMLLLP